MSVSFAVRIRAGIRRTTPTQTGHRARPDQLQCLLLTRCLALLRDIIHVGARTTKERQNQQFGLSVGQMHLSSF